MKSTNNFKPRDAEYLYIKSTLRYKTILIQNSCKNSMSLPKKKIKIFAILKLGTFWNRKLGTWKKTSFWT